MVWEISYPLAQTLHGLKGQCHEIFFRLQVFYMDQFPPSSWFYHKRRSHFFENSRRYSQIKVHHRCQWHWWQMEKSSIRKVFIISIGHFWVPELAYKINFSIKFILNCQQSDIVPIVCQQCRWHRWQICHQCRWNQGCTLTWVIREFSKNIWNDPCVIFRGLGEDDSKKSEAKNLVTLSF